MHITIFWSECSALSPRQDKKRCSTPTGHHMLDNTPGVPWPPYRGSVLIRIYAPENNPKTDTGSAKVGSASGSKRIYA